METPLPSTPPPPCCSPKSKLFCLSSGLVVLTIVAAASFLLGRALPRVPTSGRDLRGTPTIPISTPTPDKTTNWKTYKNKSDTYSLRYPPGWEFIERGLDKTHYPPSSESVDLRPIDPTLENKEFSIISIIKLLDSKGFSFYEYFKIHDWIYPGGEKAEIPKAIQNAETITVNGIEGKKFRPPIDTVGLPVIWILLEGNDNSIYLIDAVFDQSYSDIDKEKVFDLILSTFRFD